MSRPCAVVVTCADAGGALVASALDEAEGGGAAALVVAEGVGGSGLSASRALGAAVGSTVAEPEAALTAALEAEKLRATSTLARSSAPAPAPMPPTPNQVPFFFSTAVLPQDACVPADAAGAPV